MKIYFELILVSIVTVLSAGCSNSTDTGPALSKAKVDPAPYLLAAEPEGGLDVIAARESAKNDDTVVVVGRVGGGLNPWVESRAAFQIVDPSILACSDETPEVKLALVKHLGITVVRPISYQTQWLWFVLKITRARWCWKMLEIYSELRSCRPSS